MRTTKESNSQNSWYGWVVEFDRYLDDPKLSSTLEATRGFYETAKKSDIFGKVNFGEEESASEAKQIKNDDPLLMQKELLQLFEGDSSQYLSISLTGRWMRRSKRKASYSTIHEPVTEELWKNHVDGKHLIGIRPENGDKLKWSCIDIDQLTTNNTHPKNT